MLLSGAYAPRLPRSWSSVISLSASLVTSCLRSRGAFLLMSGAVGGWGGGDEARIELRWGGWFTSDGVSS